MKAKLNIQVSVHGGISFLKQNYVSPPFKIANITEDKLAACLHLTLMSSSPGILDGDDYQINIDLDEGSSLHLHTQSYQRLFDMKTGARQSMNVVLEKNASLVYLPHPCVPHQNSIFRSINHIHLKEGASLVWGEILTCGRKLNGEVFQMTYLQIFTSIYFNQKLIIKENLFMEPAHIEPNLLGQMEGYSHQGSLMVLNEEIEIPELRIEITGLLESQKNIDFGITASPIKGLLVRILGNKAEQIHDLQKSIAQLLVNQKTKAEIVE